MSVPLYLETRHAKKADLYEQLHPACNHARDALSRLLDPSCLLSPRPAPHLLASRRRQLDAAPFLFKMPCCAEMALGGALSSPAGGG